MDDDGWWMMYDDNDDGDDDGDLYFPRTPLESIQNNTQYNATWVPTHIVGPIDLK